MVDFKLDLSLSELGTAQPPLVLFFVRGKKCWIICSRCFICFDQFEFEKNDFLHYFFLGWGVIYFNFNFFWGGGKTIWNIFNSIFVPPVLILMINSNDWFDIRKTFWLILNILKTFGVTYNRLVWWPDFTRIGLIPESHFCRTRS